MVLTVDDVVHCSWWVWSWVSGTGGRRVAVGWLFEGACLCAGSGPVFAFLLFRLCLFEEGYFLSLWENWGNSVDHLDLCWIVRIKFIYIWMEEDFPCGPVVWTENFKLRWDGTGDGNSDGGWTNCRPMSAFFLKSSLIMQFVVSHLLFVL